MPLRGWQKAHIVCFTYWASRIYIRGLEGLEGLDGPAYAACIYSQEHWHRGRAPVADFFFHVLERSWDESLDRWQILGIRDRSSCFFTTSIMT